MGNSTNFAFLTAGLVVSAIFSDLVRACAAEVSATPVKCAQTVAAWFS